MVYSTLLGGSSRRTRLAGLPSKASSTEAGCTRLELVVARKGKGEKSWRRSQLGVVVILVLPVLYDVV